MISTGTGIYCAKAQRSSVQVCSRVHGNSDKEGAKNETQKGILTLWVPERESYLIQMAKFLTFRGLASLICIVSVALLWH